MVYSDKDVKALIKELFLIFILLTTLQTQYQNEHAFKNTHTYDLGKNRAESLSVNNFGNRLLVGGSSSGRIYLLDIEDLDQIRTIGRLDADDYVSYFVQLAVDRGIITSEGLDLIEEININVTDVHYLTSGRYAVATLSLRSDKAERHPILRHGILALIDMESFFIKSVHFTDANPEHIAISYNNEYILVACQGYQDDFQGNLSTTGSIMRYEMQGADLVYSSHFNFSADTEALARETFACPLGKISYKPETIVAYPNEMVALVTLQKCSSVLVLDIRTSLVTDVIRLENTTHLVDTKDNDKISFSKMLELPLEPDGIVINTSGTAFFTANEGYTSEPLKLDTLTGGRNISGYNIDGTQLYDSLSQTEVNEALVGLYRDNTSDRHGSELEDLTTGVIDGTEYLAVTAEQSRVVHFFDITNLDDVRYLGLEPLLGRSPEDIVFIPRHNAFITANENSSTISILRYIGPISKSN